MSGKKPDYEDWKSPPNLRGETPDTDEGHRIIVWLWIIGIILFSAAIWGVAELTTFLRPGPHTNTLFGP